MNHAVTGQPSRSLGLWCPASAQALLLSLIRLTQNSRSQLEHFSLGQHQWFFTGMLQPTKGSHVRCDRVVDSRERVKSCDFISYNCDFVSYSVTLQCEIQNHNYEVLHMLQREFII